MPGKSIATVLALCAFALAVTLGVIAGKSPNVILGSGLLFMVVSYVVGRVIGKMAEVAMTEHIKGYKEANPLNRPAVPVEASPGDSTEVNSEGLAAGAVDGIEAAGGTGEVVAADGGVVNEGVDSNEAIAAAPMNGAAA